MASGVYGKADLAATTWTEIVAAPTSGVKVASVSICNRSSSDDITIRIAVTADVSSVSDSDYIEYDAVIPPAGVLERTGIVLSATNGLMVYSSAASVSALAFGVDG